MKKRRIPAVIGMLLCLCSLTAGAADTGSIAVHLPVDMAGESVTIRGEDGQAYSLQIMEDGTAKAETLAEGIYEIQVPETEKYTFTEAKVSIPMWSEEEHKMLYDLVVIPKYSVKEQASPGTGDAGAGIFYLGIAIISCIILVIMSCHNRFNCATMTGKYLKNGGYRDGNDNDTENPRCTRRIRISGPGTTD